MSSGAEQLRKKLEKKDILKLWIGYHYVKIENLTTFITFSLASFVRGSVKIADDDQLKI